MTRTSEPLRSGPVCEAFLPSWATARGMERGKAKAKERRQTTEKDNFPGKAKEERESKKRRKRDERGRRKRKGKGREEGKSGRRRRGEQPKEKGNRALTKPLLEPREKNKRILVLGLDGAGKTSVLHSLALNRVQHSEAPTQGFNAICINTEDGQMEFLEIGGGEPFRSYWEMYLSRGLLLIFVVDSADHNRLPEAKKYLHQLIETNPILWLCLQTSR